MAPKIKNPSNDFDPDHMFKSIQENVDKLSSDLRQPDKFAQIFCEAAKSQKSIDAALKAVLIDLLQKDSEAQEVVTSLIEKADRNFVRLLNGKIGWAIGTITLLFVEALIFKFLKW